MNKIIKYAQYGCLSMLFVLTSCVRDGLDECPPAVSKSYIQFRYDYNMSFECLFAKQVSEMDVYLFDEDGIYINKIEDWVTTGTFGKNYLMEIPEQYDHAAKFIAWSGCSSDRITACNMVPGRSTMEELTVSILDNQPTRDMDTQFKSLFYGSVFERTKSKAITPDTTKNVTEIPLVKNTNTIRIVFQSLVNGSDVEEGDFEVSLNINHGSYDYENNPADENAWTFKPYYTYKDPESGYVIELNTLRLLANADNTLKIKNTANGNILEIDLNKYLNALKLQTHDYMPLQEFMDREDSYKMIMLVNKDIYNYWVIFDIQINPWVDREQGSGTK